MTRRSITDVILGVWVEDGDWHAEITLTPAPGLWADGTETFEGMDESTAESAQHLLVGLLARLALTIQQELAVERVTHGCQLPAWYALDEHGRQRRLRRGDKAPAADQVCVDWSDCCAVLAPHPSLDELFQFNVSVTVPRKRLGYWKRRVSALLDELVASVPQ